MCFLTVASGQGAIIDLQLTRNSAEYRISPFDALNQISRELNPKAEKVKPRTLDSTSKCNIRFVKGMAAAPPLWIPGLRLETLSAMDTPHRLETLSAMDTPHRLE